MKERVKTLFNLFIRVGLSGILLAFIFSRIDLHKTQQVLISADLGYVWMALGIFCFINGLLVSRWFLFMRAVGLNVPVFSAVRYFFIGLFGNLFLPSSIGGDIIKVLGLCRETSQKPAVVASVLLDRLSGFAAIVIVAVSTFTFGSLFGVVNDIRLALPIALIAFLSIGVAFLLFNEKIYRLGCRLFGFFPKLRIKIMEMHGDILLLRRHWRLGAAAIALSCFSQMCYSMTFYLTALALHHPVPLVYCLIFVPLICVSASVPSIGGLGVREAGAAYLFSRIGVSSEIAVSMSLVSFLFMVILGLLGGAIYVLTLSYRRIQCPAPDAGVVRTIR
ncbi:MAG: flippase-like domain-containing protein [Candidatus Omnitrophica bacterium]|nr:flippase-like domain-containing protein [Candidatus Omnitrophota bacterium]